MLFEDPKKVEIVGIEKGEEKHVGKEGVATYIKEA